MNGDNCLILFSSRFSLTPLSHFDRLMCVAESDIESQKGNEEMAEEYFTLRCHGINGHNGARKIDPIC